MAVATGFFVVTGLTIGVVGVAGDLVVVTGLTAEVTGVAGFEVVGLTMVDRVEGLELVLAGEVATDSKMSFWAPIDN